MEHVHKILEPIYRNIYKRHGPVFCEILLNWEKIIGSRYANRSRPIKIRDSSGGLENKTLYVESDNSSLSMELSYQHDIIIEKITIFLGNKSINKIKFTIRPII